MERATGAEVYGCGSPQSTDITLNIQTTTGGNFSISLNGKNTVEHLKKLVSKKLKVSKDRICLLHRERQLRDGTLEENGLLDGSRVILLPSVETGLLSQRTENSVMQALESLNDTQVNDFLSGKSPLNLTMRLGDHMMLIQLQLSTLNSAASSSTSRSLRTSTPTKGTAVKSVNKHDIRETPSPRPLSPLSTSPSESESSPEKSESKQSKHNILHKETYSVKSEDVEMFCNDLASNNAVRSKSVEKNTKDETLNSTTDTLYDSTTSLDSEQSPIKSLSNLVSSPLDASSSDNKNTVVNAVKNSLIDILSSNLASGKKETTDSTATLISSDKPCDAAPFIINPESSSDDSDTFTDQSSFLAENTIDEYPMESLFNSAVDKGLFENQDETMMDREISNLATSSLSTNDASTSGPLPSFQNISEPLKTKRFHYLLHKTSKFKHPIGQNKQKAFMQSVVNKHKKRMQIRQDCVESQPSTSRTEPYSPRKLLLQPSSSQSLEDPQPSTSRQCLSTTKLSDSPKSKSQPGSPTPPPIPDARALLEASKNLTQTLKKLSKEVLTNKIDLRNTEETARSSSRVGPGAVIESMKHHGKGIYSGTFSGTLNPALQDRYGRPKRDISTIIHILNDLLCAAPPIAISQRETKHSCAAGAEDASKCGGCGQCAGRAAAAPRERRCACGARPAPAAPCARCDSARALELENTKTKCKLEQLRLVMQQKKQRREARKLKTLPYAGAPKGRGPPDRGSPVQEEIETVA